MNNYLKVPKMVCITQNNFLIGSVLASTPEADCKQACVANTECYDYATGRIDSLKANECILLKPGCNDFESSSDYDFHSFRNIEAPSTKPETCTHKAEFSQSKAAVNQCKQKTDELSCK